MLRMAVRETSPGTNFTSNIEHCFLSQRRKERQEIQVFMFKYKES